MVTLHNSNFPICLMPTTYGDIQKKNQQPIFGEVETSMKMTFHLPGENQRATRRKRKPLSNTPLLFFHYENVFSKNRKDKPRQTRSHLTPMIMSQISPENQIPKRTPSATSAPPQSEASSFWSLVLGKWSLKTCDLNPTLIGRKST